MTDPAAKRDCQIYLLTPALLPPDFSEKLKAALGAGEIAALQLRLKNCEEDDWKRAIELLRPITATYNVALMINDRPDLAVAYGADGAHVGGEDMAVAQARKILGPNLQLGASCYNSRDLAMTAGEDGADSSSATSPAAVSIALRVVSSVQHHNAAFPSSG